MRLSATSLILTGLAAGSVLAMGPEVTVEASPAAACADTVGRDLLTVDGFALDISSSAFTAPELSSPANTQDITGPAPTPLRTVPFHFAVDAAPYEQVEITASITWDSGDSVPGDYDLWAYTYTDGFRHDLGSSVDSNIDGGDTRIESFSATVGDCQLVDLDIRSWAGAPQMLSLTLDVTPVGEPVEDVLARPADARTRLYLGGDRPGNAGAASDYVGQEDYPFASTLVAERPSSATPNATTHLLAGFTTERNPLQPWWGAELSTFPSVSGHPSAVVWLSSLTQEQEPTSIDVQLFLNGQEHTVTIPGSALGDEPRPFLVEFGEVDTQVFTVTLQVSTPPMVATSGPMSDKVGDANHTVWFDGVQFPSRLYLPTAAS